MSKTVIQKDREAKNGERTWCETVKEHGLFIVVICLTGPLSVLNGLLMYVLTVVDECDFAHLHLDFRRMALMWVANGLLWIIVIVVVSYV